MKRIVLGLAAFALLAFSTQAMAAAARVPTNLCFQRSPIGDFVQVVLKTNGVLKSTGGNIKQYGISGYGNFGIPFPLTGNAYVAPASTTLHGTLNGAYDVSGVHRNAVLEFFLDLATATGTTTLWLQRSNGSDTTNATNITVFDCKTLPIAGLILGEGTLTSDQ